MTINPPGSIQPIQDQITDTSGSHHTNSHTSAHTQTFEDSPAATVEISPESQQAGKHNHQER